jgi:GWxTD domain-containing protein
MVGNRRNLVCAATALVAMLACLPRAEAQPRGEFPGMADEMRRVFYEATSRLGDDPAHARIDVFYRIEKEFFVAFRDPDSTGPAAFRRRGEVLLELLDSTGISRAREIRRIDRIDPSGTEPMAERTWYAGAVSLSAVPGRYTIVIEVDDLESERHFFERERTIDARATRADTLADSDPFFVFRPAGNSPAGLILQNLAGDVLFGSPGALAFEIAGVVPDTARFRYAIAASTERFSENDPKEVTGGALTPLLLPGRLVLSDDEHSDSIRYRILRGDRAVTTVVVPLPLEKLPLRRYQLTGRMSTGIRTAGMTVRFRNVWPDMPMSLRDVDMALEALRYVTRPSQLDSLKSGDFEERRDHLEGFWKPRDPDSSTAYNEVMTQYYRRVDHAMRTFGSLQEPDGWRSDRGRIFILHGPPARVDRTLDPKTGFREVWTYAAPNRTFVFLDRSRSGTYVLVSPKNTEPH